MKHLGLIAVAVISLSVTCLSQTVIPAHLKLVSAYTKTVPESKQSNPPMAGYFFVVKWQEKTPPEAFFWRGDGGWLNCRIEKACKKGKNYIGKDIDLGKVRKGATLLLTPVTGGRFPVPEEIPETAKNTLYYKTAGSGWIGFPVNKLTKK